MQISRFVQETLKYNEIPESDWERHLSQDVDSIEFPVYAYEKEIQDYFEAYKLTGKPIMTGSDYDCDHTTGAAVLRTYLKHAGFNMPREAVHIPTRSEGYGLNATAIKERKDKLDIGLIISIDSGISNKLEIDYANSLGIDVIITDHHEVPNDPEKIPSAKFILHPAVEPSIKEMINFSGSGMAYYLCHILEKRFKTGFPLELWAGVAAIGTIGDVTRLVGLNREFAKFGIRQARKPGIIGLDALKSVCNIDPAEMDEETFGFNIIPRINAAGRVSDPMWAIAALVTEDYAGAYRAAQKLNALNNERKEISAMHLDVSRQAVDPDEPIILVCGEFSHGIVGITAANLVDEFGKPAFILVNEGFQLKGSARSPKWYSVIDALNYASKALLRFGGHPQAGGFSLEPDKLQEFYDLLVENYHQQIKCESETETKYLEWDPEFDSCDLISDIRLMKPFGQGFRPVEFKSIGVIEKPKADRSGKHLFCKVFGRKAVGWRCWDESLTDGKPREIIYSLEVSNYGTVKPYIRLNIKSIKEVESETENEF